MGSKGWVSGGWVGDNNGWVCGMQWVGGGLCFLFLFLFFCFGGCDRLMLVGGDGCGLIFGGFVFLFFLVFFFFVLVVAVSVVATVVVSGSASYAVVFCCCC